MHSFKQRSIAATAALLSATQPSSSMPLVAAQPAQRRWLGGTKSGRLSAGERRSSSDTQKHDVSGPATTTKNSPVEPVPLHIIESTVECIGDLLDRRPRQCGLMLMNVPLTWNSADLAEYVEDTLRNARAADDGTPAPCYWVSKKDIQKLYGSKGDGVASGPFAGEFGLESAEEEDANVGLEPEDVSFKLSEAQLEWLSDPAEVDSLVNQAVTASSLTSHTPLKRSQIKSRLGALLPLLTASAIDKAVVRYSQKMGVSLGSGLLFLRDEFQPAISLTSRPDAEFSNPAEASNNDVIKRIGLLKSAVEDFNQLLLTNLRTYSPTTTGLRKPPSDPTADAVSNTKNIKDLDAAYFTSNQLLLETFEILVKEIEGHHVVSTSCSGPELSGLVLRLTSVVNSAFVAASTAPNIHKDCRKLLELGAKQTSQQQQQQRTPQISTPSNVQDSSAEAEKAGKKRNPWAPHELEEFTQTPTLTVPGHTGSIALKLFDPTNSIGKEVYNYSRVLEAVRTRNKKYLPIVETATSLEPFKDPRVQFESASVVDRESRALREASGNLELTLSTLDLDRFLLSPDLLYDFSRMRQRKVVAAAELQKSLRDVKKREQLELARNSAHEVLGKKTDNWDDEDTWEALSELGHDGVHHFCEKVPPIIVSSAREKLYELLAEYVSTTAKRGKWDLAHKAPANPSQPLIPLGHFYELVRAALMQTLSDDSPSESGESGVLRTQLSELKHFVGSSVKASDDFESMRTQLGRGSRLNLVGTSGNPYLLHKRMH